MKRLLAITVVVVVAAVAGGVAFAAAIVGSDGVIHGCRNDKSGTLSVVDSTQTCPRGTSSLNWNQQGVPGPAGTFTSLNDAEGAACNTANPDLAGTVHFVYDDSIENQPHALMIICQPTKKALSLLKIDATGTIYDPETGTVSTVQGSGTLTVTPPGETYGAGNGAGTLWYAPGTVVTLTATSGAGSHTGWSDACVDAVTTCTLTMTNDVEVTVSFSVN